MTERQIAPLPPEAYNAINQRTTEVLGLARRRLQYQHQHTVWIDHEHQSSPAALELLNFTLEPEGKDFLAGFTLLNFGVTCDFIKITPSGDMVILTIDTNSPYAEFDAQKIDRDGKAIASLNVTRTAGDGDGDWDNWYTMQGFDRRLARGKRDAECAVTFVGSNTTYERMEDLSRVY